MRTVATRKELASEKKIEWLTNRKTKGVPSEDKSRLKKFLVCCVCGTDIFETTYHYGKNSVNNSGRLYQDIGLQNFPKNIRNFIAGEFYHDVDQVLSLPTILQDQLAKNKISCPNLDNYIENRPTILSEKKIKKQDVIAMLFEGRRVPDDPFFAEIHECIYKSLVPILKSKEEYAELWAVIEKSRAQDHKNNRMGSFLSHVTQTIEHQILLSMEQYFAQNGWIVDTLIFDGFLVRRRQDTDLTSEILNDCENHVKVKTSYNIKLALKPMETTLVLPEVIEVQKMEDETEDMDDSDVHISVLEDETISAERAAKIYRNGKYPERLINYLNNFFAKIQDLSLFAFREKRNEDYVIRDKPSTRIGTEHLKIGQLKKPFSLFDFFNSHPNQLRYRKIVMDPKNVDDGIHLNLFKGFAATKLVKYDYKKVEPILYHIKRIWANNDEGCSEYILNWLAHMFQRPWIKIGTAMFIFGEQGCGKNIMGEFIGELMVGKEHYYYFNDLDDVTGQFTGAHANKIFAIGDEVTFAGGHKTNSKLKSLITQKLQKLEKKRQDAILLDNFLNFIFFSNSKECVKIEKGDRRIFLREAASFTDPGLKAKYMNNLSKYLGKSGADQFYTYLLDRDISNFKPADLPRTSEKEDLQALGAQPFDQFIQMILNGELRQPIDYSIEEALRDKYYEPGQTYILNKSFLWDSYKDFHKNGGFREEMINQIYFAKQIRHFIQIEYATKHRTTLKMTVAPIDKVIGEHGICNQIR